MNHLHNNKSEQTTDSSFTLDIEQLLKQGNVIRIKPQGTSMYPLFVLDVMKPALSALTFLPKSGDVILTVATKVFLFFIAYGKSQATPFIWSVTTRLKLKDHFALIKSAAS